MLLPSIRRLALADLDEDTLRELVEHGEDLLVERKRTLPQSPGFGAAAASFANTLGGWILLGVGDDKKLHGYTKPRNLDLQSHLASVLRNESDPLPPFVADMRELDGTPLAVLRVFESTDPPHIVRGTGAVYVRSSKGKEPVDDHRTLLELARRGAEAEAAARERLVEMPLIKDARWYRPTSTRDSSPERPTRNTSLCTSGQPLSPSPPSSPTGQSPAGTAAYAHASRRRICCFRRIATTRRSQPLLGVSSRGRASVQPSSPGTRAGPCTPWRWPTRAELSQRR